MNRRNFLRNSSLAGFSFPALAKETARINNDKNNALNGNNKILFKDIDLHEVTIDELQQKMQSGELSSKSITQWYLKRIKETDKDGPKLNSVIEVNPDAELIAEVLDYERKNGKVRGPLHGMPVLLRLPET